MSGNLLNNSNLKGSSGLANKLKSFFNKNDQKEYSDNFAKEKEIIVDYKTKINEEKKKEIVQPSIKSVIEEPKLDLLAFNSLDKDSEENEKIKPKKLEKKASPNLSIAGIAKIAREKTSGWQAPKMVTTNLIQSETLTYMDWASRIKMLSLAIAIPVLVLIFAYFILIYLDIQARAEANILGAEIEFLNEQVEVAEEKVGAVDQFKGKLSLIKNLLDKHVYWTNLFSFLEKNILSESVILGGFSGDTMGQYSFNIISESYSNVPEQIMILRENDLVESAEISEAKQGVIKISEGAMQKAAVTYSLKLKLDPRIFYKNIKE